MKLGEMAGWHDGKGSPGFGVSAGSHTLTAAARFRELGKFLNLSDVRIIPTSQGREASGDDIPDCFASSNAPALLRCPGAESELANGHPGAWTLAPLWAPARPYQLRGLEQIFNSGKGEST